MKALNKMRTLLGVLAITAVVPTALQAQKPLIYGYPTLDRSIQAPALQGAHDPALAALTQTADWALLAQNSNIRSSDGRVLVEVNGSEESIQKLIDAVSRDGNIRLLNAKAPTMRRMWVQPENLAELEQLVGSLPGVKLSAYRAPVANSYGSEGVGAMRAEFYTAAGLDGTGVTIAVLDEGFAGLEMPDGLINNDASDHGTAMVEVVRDLAPASKIVTCRIDENLDVYTATQSALDEGADIIVCALSWFELPAQGLASDAARLALKHDVLWVNAAGNFADGAYLEGENFGTVDMLDGTTMLTFENETGGYMQYLSDFEVGGNVTLHFDYETPSDSGGPRATKAALALEVYSWDEISGTFYLVGYGNPEMDHQAVSFDTAEGLDYFPMVRVMAPGVISGIRMFSPDARLYYSSAEGSMANPAAVPGVISVGAVNAGNYNGNASVESYSSQGGGIFNLSLTLCGPTDVSTGTYGPQGFSGTSAAAAHVAGLLALQLQDPMLSKAPTELLRFTEMDDENAAGEGLVMAMVDDFEPDNDCSVRQMILTRQIVEDHMLSPSSDIDWFNFSLAQDLSLDVKLAGLAGISIYTDELALIAETVGNKLHLAALAAGNYKLALTAIADADPRYTVAINTYEGAPEAVSDLTVNVRDEDQTAISAGFTWSKPAGLGEIIYLLEVAADEDFNSVIFGMELEEVEVPVVELEAGTVYFVRITAINEFGASEPSMVLQFITQDRGMILSGSINDHLDSEDSVTANAIAAPTIDDDTEQAAGCVGTDAGNGIAILLLALLGAAAALRFIRVHGRKEVVAE